MPRVDGARLRRCLGPQLESLRELQRAGTLRARGRMERMSRAHSRKDNPDSRKKLLWTVALAVGLIAGLLGAGDASAAGLSVPSASVPSVSPEVSAPPVLPPKTTPP